MQGEFSSTRPIYLQVVERLCKRLVKGVLAPGEKLPSVRDMAVEMGINPNTVQRVYAELERMSVVETRRGQGTFVTDNAQVLARLRADMKTSRTRAFIQDMDEMGVSGAEMLEGLAACLRSRDQKEDEAE